MSDNLERPNYYAILPASVRYSEVTPRAILLYAEVTALCNKTGTCWASNKYFSNLFRVSIPTISRLINELVEAGFVESDINKKAGNRRFIRVTDVPILKNDNSYTQKRDDNNNKTNTNLNVGLKEKEQSLISLVNKITGRDFRVLPRGSKKTLDTFTLVEIESALTALARDPWHQPKLKELSSDYLLRASTIDKFKSAGTPTGEAYGYKNGKKVFSEDEDGNSYWGGELITPQNQDRVLEERNSQ